MRAPNRECESDLDVCARCRSVGWGPRVLAGGSLVIRGTALPVRVLW